MRDESRSQKSEARSAAEIVPLLILSSVFCLLASFPLAAEVVDRIVAVVEGHIITLSDIRQEREIRTRLGEKPSDDDKVIAKELADKHLIERQIADYPNVDVSDAEVDAELRRFTTGQQSPSTAVRNAVRLRIRIQKFFDLKFGASIRPTDEQIRQYYADVFVPAAKARGLDPVPPIDRKSVV